MAQIIAHRGSSKIFPENTAAAFRHAVESGAELLEVDIRRSADGVLYCIHDSHLRRLTGQPGTVEQTRSKELDTLLINGTEPTFRFADFLKQFGNRTGIVLDIKSAGIEQLLLREIEANPPQQELIFSSFSATILTRLRELNSALRLAYIVGPWRNLGWHLGISQNLIERLKGLGCAAAHIHKRLARPDTIAALHAAGLAVSVWTVDDPAIAGRLVAARVDGIISNRPAELVRQLP